MAIYDSCTKGDNIRDSYLAIKLLVTASPSLFSSKTPREQAPLPLSSSAWNARPAIWYIIGPSDVNRLCNWARPLACEDWAEFPDQYCSVDCYMWSYSYFNAALRELAPEVASVFSTTKVSTLTCYSNGRGSPSSKARAI